MKAVSETMPMSYASATNKGVKKKMNHCSRRGETKERTTFTMKKEDVKRLKGNSIQLELDWFHIKLDVRPDDDPQQTAEKAHEYLAKTLNEMNNESYSKKVDIKTFIAIQLPYNKIGMSITDSPENRSFIRMILEANQKSENHPHITAPNFRTLILAVTAITNTFLNIDKEEEKMAIVRSIFDTMNMTQRLDTTDLDRLGSDASMLAGKLCIPYCSNRLLGDDEINYLDMGEEDGSKVMTIDTDSMANHTRTPTEKITVTAHKMMDYDADKYPSLEAASLKSAQNDFRKATRHKNKKVTKSDEKKQPTAVKTTPQTNKNKNEQKKDFSEDDVEQMKATAAKQTPTTKKADPLKGITSTPANNIKQHIVENELLMNESFRKDNELYAKLELHEADELEKKYKAELGEAEQLEEDRRQREIEMTKTLAETELTPDKRAQLEQNEETAFAIAQSQDDRRRDALTSLQRTAKVLEKSDGSTDNLFSPLADDEDDCMSDGDGNTLKLEDTPRKPATIHRLPTPEQNRKQLNKKVKQQSNTDKDGDSKMLVAANSTCDNDMGMEGDDL
jgi:hypothetical protein